MNPEDRRLLERAVELGEENNKILHGIRRAGRLGMIWKAIYWVLIIAISYGAYVYVQPYIDKLTQVYTGFQSDMGTVKSATGNVGGLLKNFGI